MLSYSENTDIAIIFHREMLLCVFVFVVNVGVDGVPLGYDGKAKNLLLNTSTGRIAVPSWRLETDSDDYARSSC